MKLETAVLETVSYLESAAADAAIRADPYWPKWDGPWWRMTLLWEMGLAARIPASAARAMVDALNRHYFRDFPPDESSVAPGKSIYHHYPCHCMVGTIFQVLHAREIAADDELPWLRDWILKYQLDDGGYNCDNGNTRNSSFISTLPPVEAILNCTPRPFTPAEKSLLDCAANYLIERRLACSKRTGALLDAEWQIPSFPRFYLYDTLRGLTFLAGWAEKTGATLPAAAVQASIAALDQWFAADNPAPRRTQLAVRTLRQVDGDWQKQPAAGSFPLLDLSADSEVGGIRLREEWDMTRKKVTRHMRSTD